MGPGPAGPLSAPVCRAGREGGDQTLAKRDQRFFGRSEDDADQYDDEDDDDVRDEHSLPDPRVLLICPEPPHGNQALRSDSLIPRLPMLGDVPRPGRIEMAETGNVGGCSRWAYR